MCVYSPRTHSLARTGTRIRCRINKQNLRKWPKMRERNESLIRCYKPSLDLLQFSLSLSLSLFTSHSSAHALTRTFSLLSLASSSFEFNAYSHSVFKQISSPGQAEMEEDTEKCFGYKTLHPSTSIELYRTWA